MFTKPDETPRHEKHNAHKLLTFPWLTSCIFECVDTLETQPTVLHSYKPRMETVNVLLLKCQLLKCRRATREELQTSHSEAYVHMYASSARHRDPAVFG